MHATRLPEHALGVDVEMKMARFNGAQSAGFFGGLALGGLAVREPGLRRSFGKGPLISAVGVHQQEFHGGATLAVTDRGHLQRQRLRNARRTHGTLSSNRCYLENISAILMCNINCAGGMVTKGGTPA